jgi:hypothetical protein
LESSRVCRIFISLLPSTRFNLGLLFVLAIGIYFAMLRIPSQSAEEKGENKNSEGDKEE